MLEFEHVTSNSQLKRVQDFHTRNVAEKIVRVVHIFNSSILRVPFKPITSLSANGTVWKYIALYSLVDENVFCAY